ncbi:hypothetical protein [Streptomyces gilvosporeus]|uniref:Secreted protein n=1 Tax=Streptomyces gilvosporeus TaxID=553510 RepID=A0A1V0TJD0_9ACTN|nr:hypothetical protein [Streptomyces gilvosporeus]ARF53046.1 hypothetical protein B1H19_01605 [Streptomyces gilvosporeus]
MRKLRKAAVVIAALGAVSLLGAGNAYADGEYGGGQGGGKGGGSTFNVKQGSQCRSHDLNVDVLGEVGLVNGLLGNALGGEGNAGSQDTKMGSSMGCNNSFADKGGKGDE